MTLRLRRIVLLLLALSLLMASLVWHYWEPDRPVSALAPRWAAAPSQFVSIQGMQVHLRDEGPRDDAEPIVLLHGTSASLHTWNGWTTALTSSATGGRRVIRMDLPGFALTGPHPQDDYSLDMYASFVVAVLDQLKLQRVVLAGNSLGGQIAWYTAVKHPQRVSRLVLVDAAGYPFEWTSAPLAFKIAQVPVLRTLTRYFLPRDLVKRSVQSAYGDPQRVTEELVDLYVDMTLREGVRRALPLRFALRDENHSELIPNIAQPTLILWGKKDLLIDVKWAEAFARDLPHAKLTVFADLGHVPQEEDPARTVAEVQRFLAQ